MKKIIISLTAGLALAIGGAGLAGAQVDPDVTIDTEEVEPGGDVTIGVEGAEPEAEIEVEIGDATGSGTADADGNGSVTVTIPDTVEPGEVDGIVTINGVDVPISVLIAAAGDGGEGGDGAEGGEAGGDGAEGGEAGGDGAEGGEAGGDGTPAPTAVNTGDELSSSTNTTVLFAAAASLLLLGGGALTLRSRSSRH